MTDTVACTIVGEPVAQGSKRIFGTRLVEASDAKLRPWRELVTWHLLRARANRPPLVEPVVVTLTFRLRPPQRATKWWNKPGGPHGTKPDIDKLSRAVLDALTAAKVVGDDSLVFELRAVKRYATEGQECGVVIWVERSGTYQ